jgi:hypothetical protein
LPWQRPASHWQRRLRFIPVLSDAPRSGIHPPSTPLPHGCTVSRGRLSALHTGRPRTSNAVPGSSSRLIRGSTSGRRSLRQVLPYPLE